jgi:hypothetical protein
MNSDKYIQSETNTLFTINFILYLYLHNIFSRHLTTVQINTRKNKPK